MDNTKLYSDTIRELNNIALLAASGKEKLEIAAVHSGHIYDAAERFVWIERSAKSICDGLTGVGEDSKQEMDADAWAELYRLREAVKGPDGFATWQEAATAERVRRVKAERALAEAQPRISEMLAALVGVVRVADRSTVEFDAARAAIAAAGSKP